jgi:hypothetical protein
MKFVPADKRPETIARQLDEPYLTYTEDCGSGCAQQQPLTLAHFALPQIHVCKPLAFFEIDRSIRGLSGRFRAPMQYLFQNKFLVVGTKFAAHVHAEVDEQMDSGSLRGVSPSILTGGKPSVWRKYSAVPSGPPLH